MIADADAVVICTPEYAGALPGSFKNALDWTVGSTVFTDKPVAWIAVAADERRGAGAHAELATVLNYVQAQVLLNEGIHVPVDRSDVGSRGLIVTKATIEAVTGAVGSVVSAAASSRITAL